LVKTSKIALANTLSKSVRATIPNDVVEHLGLEVGDVIEWETFREGGKQYAKIRKLQ
jgi:bifunctional DNA-binding transcriptional regulator/antitoxin component of YhaV-PrlF toxin-antitoxin module